MHHKRGRPKKRRAGCLFCKPHKGNGQTKEVKVRGLRVRRPLASIDATEVEDAKFY